jgi:pimeloyl-ACP methyl ester carboxylesterase
MLGTGGNTIVIPNAVHMIDSFQGLARGHRVIFFDLRNRGRSESVADRKLLTHGIHHDVDDIEAIRHHFGVEKSALLGHSYVGLTAVLYAMKFGRCLDRVIQIGPVQLRAGSQYPAHLTCVDAAFAAFMNKLSQ